MADKDNSPTNPNIPVPGQGATDDGDFGELSKKLLGIYQPILEEELKRAATPDQLEKESLSPPNCQDELDFANRIFNSFLTDDVAIRLLPKEGRELLGPIERWRWCLLHIRCCIIFGWLVCRRPRTFRAFVYYAYRYWLCVREAIGTPVSNPPKPEEKQDFATLVHALAAAYKPYLTDQLASVEFPAGIPDEVLGGRIDCFEGEEEAAAVFERFLTLETAPALLGKAAFEAHRRDPFFQFCRCWCLCSIRFGCCLAGVRNLAGLLRCLRLYIRCIRDCFRPLVCQILTPAADSCAEATFVPACSPLIAVPIVGTAAGAAFDHYTLSYSFGGNPPVNDAVVYPDCTRPPAHTSFTTPIFSSTLGYLDVFLLPTGVTEFTIFLDVFDSKGGHTLCTQSFKLRTTAVEITAAAKVNALVGEDPFNPGTFPKLIKSVNDPNPAVPETSIGGAFSADGSAYTVGCDRIMTQFLMSRFAVNPLAPVPTFPDATGGTPLLPTGAVVYADSPAHPWNSGCLGGVSSNIILNGDLVAQWAVRHCTFLGMPYTVPKVEALPFWDSTPLNGRFVLHLEVRDHVLPGGPFPGTVAAVDQVAVWIDNQQPIGLIKSIGGTSGCQDLHLKDYLGTTAEIVGVAWDPPIDPAAPQKAPNDNFGTYSMSFQKNGGGSGVIPIAAPHVRVPNIFPGPLGGAVGTLTNWDIVAALDGGSGPLPPGSPKLVRGDRCPYVVVLEVSDNTHVGDSGSNHSTGPILYAINVINDIP
ncbi:MAG TPA: hypothetical protein VKJ45_19560 [Blastocatellia bacterium]|nr:hypothetical protein [Blastocatellia bacterium]